MSDTIASENKLGFTPEDLQLVETFRRRTDTSVLTIMFTDIEGFTALAESIGDQAVNELRRRHDELVRAAIESDGAGKVVKHIGDAVMAVFSEPSAAVERALAIQERMREFNRRREGQAELLVRIGLHMGQVTAENEVNLDVFGRHVNRASRIVGMAGGGQIYLTYGVFDSARGWLSTAGQDAATWTRHGEYYVKGIADPIAVYEVYVPSDRRPRPPRGGKPRRSRSTLIAAGLGLVAAAAAVWLVMLLGPSWNARPQSGAVTLVNMPDSPVFLDQKTRLVLDGAKGQRVRKVLTEIPVGEHLLHWGYSSGVRYYAPINVTEGDNTLEPRFPAHPLPSMRRRAEFTGREPYRKEHRRSAKYVTYDAANRSRDRQADLSLTILIARDTADPARLTFTYNWRVSVKDAEPRSGSIAVIRRADDPHGVRHHKKIWADESHYYEIHYSTRGPTTQFGIRGQYVPEPPQ